jgi:membrane protein
VVGLILEGLKYVNLAITPYLQKKLEHEYFIFRYSVAILLWSFVASLVVLGGAEWTARQEAQTASEAPPEMSADSLGPSA